MKYKYKANVGEWVAVYKRYNAIITTNKNMENMSADEIAKLLYYDKDTHIESCGKEDYDWTTEEHDAWDTDEKFGIKILEEIKEQ